MIRDHGPQVRHDFLVPAERKQHIGSLFGSHRSQLAEPHPLGLGERPRHASERDASPQRERRVELGDRAVPVITLAQLAGPAQMLLEGNGVRLTRDQVQDIARPGGDQDPAWAAGGPVRFDDAAKTRHIGVDPALRASGRILSPNRVDQLASGNDPVSPHSQDAEDGLLPGLTHGQLLVIMPGCYRTKYADAQHLGIADLPLARPTRTLRPPPRAERHS